MLSTQTVRQPIGDHFALINPDAATRERLGIYTAGVCHLRAVFACVPVLERMLDRTACVYYKSLGGHGRSDQQLQTLQHMPADVTAPIIEKLYLDEDYFRPTLFEKTFTVPDFEDLGEFPKSVVIISTAFDAGGQSLYRHRQNGLLVDPCRGWINSQNVLDGDPSAIPWFRENFESIGMIPVEAFIESFSRLIETLRQKTEAPVVVMNQPILDPLEWSHDYQFTLDSQPMRWLRFNVALADLSRTLDFCIVDVDRVLREAGVLNRYDFLHFLPSQNVLVGREIFRVLKELSIV